MFDWSEGTRLRESVPDDADLWAEFEDTWLLGSEALDLFDDDSRAPALRSAKIAVGDARSALEAFVVADIERLSGEELLGLLEVGEAVEAMARAATLRLIAEAEGRRTTIVSHQVKTSTFLAHHLNVVSVDRARELVRLGRLVRERFTTVGAALATGAVSMEQAEAIVATMRKLPEELPVESSDRAERELVELARSHNPRDLRMAANLVVELLAPEVAEADAEAAIRRLDAAADAGDRCSSTTIPSRVALGSGGCSHRLKVPTYGSWSTRSWRDPCLVVEVSRPVTTGQLRRSARMPSWRSFTATPILAMRRAVARTDLG
jgi:hypothetical protein